VPTQRGAQLRASHIIEEFQLPGLFGERVTTFEGFVRQLLRGTDFEARLIDAGHERIMLTQCIHAVLESQPDWSSLASVMQSSGFISHLQRTITQIKQSAVDPDELDKIYARKKSKTVLDDAITSIYRRYQQQLVIHHLYDLPGMYWMADECCKVSRPAFFDTHSTIIFDGFDDFTPSEFRLIESSAMHMKELGFGLACDLDANREDAYTLVKQTLDKITRSFPDSSHQATAAAPTTTTTQFAFRNLFWRTVPQPCMDIETNLSFMHCHTVTHELESVARRIKKIISDDGVAPSRIAVVGRNLSQDYVAIREIFSEYEIPLATTFRPPLTCAPLFRSIANTLLTIRQWDRLSLVTTLTDPLVGPWSEACTKHRRHFPTLVRCAQIRRGKEDCFRALESLQKELGNPIHSPVDALVAAMPDAPTALEHLLERLQWLREVDEQFPADAPLQDYVLALESAFLGDEQMKGLLERCGDEERPALVSSYSALRGLFENLNAYPPTSLPLDRVRFSTLLTDGATASSTDSHTEKQGVICTEPETARHLKFDYVFLMGVREGVYPNPSSTNAVIPEAERKRLMVLGLPLDSDESLVLRERLVFLRMLSIAQKELVISWHTRLTNGQEGRPSPFIAELEELPCTIPKWKPETVAQTLVPEPQYVRSRRDALNFFQVSNQFPAAFPSAAKIQMEAGQGSEARRREKAFNSFDAHLQDSGHQREIRALYGDSHVYSAGQIESYLKCPFQFFLERILNVPQWPEPGNELTPLLRGSIYHDVLELFYRANARKSHAELDPNAARKQMEDILEHVFEQKLWQQKGLTKGIRRIEEQRLRKALKQYLTRMLEQADSQWKPAFFEAAFGLNKSESGDDVSIDEPFSIDSSLGPLKFSGRIDRIDEGSGDAVRIVDYKSKVDYQKKAAGKGKAVQIPLYARAVEEALLPGSDCIDGRYIGVMSYGEAEVLKREGKKPVPWDEHKKGNLEVIESVIEHIRSAHFHPEPGDKPCAGCPNHRICRFDRVRLEQKEWD
jgi:ATP-dependent helicase/DNAse subunit B